MNSWEEINLGKYMGVLSGYAFKSSTFSSSGIPVIKIKNVASGKLNFEDVQYYSYALDAKLEKYIISNGDILIAMTGSHADQPSSMVGRVAKYNLTDTALLNQRVGKLYSSDKKKLDEKYLYYFFKQEYVTYDLAQNAGGSANQANISPNQIKSIKAYLPPCPEQNAIASVLSSLDDNIELLQKQNEILDVFGITLFTKIFFNENSGWTEKSLDQIAHYLNGLALQKYPPEGSDYLPVIKIKELRHGISEESDIASPNIPREYIIEDGDVLFSWSGSLEIIIWGQGIGALNQHLFKVTSDKYPKWFYYYATKYHLPEFRQIALDKATTMGHIQRQHLTEALVPIPPKEIIDEMNSKFSPIIDKIILNNSEIKKLTKLRDTLLPKLMSGEVRVKY